MIDDTSTTREPSTGVTAEQIADALGKPRPTAQQRAVIESPLGPALVVAGAGSGKTETMSNRVLWLLANGHVTAEEILGLTFTRKAAGELGERIRANIAALAEVGLIAGEHDEFSAPTVTTYNSFANTIYRDHAILIGREGDGTVLGAASSWQLARRIVVASDDPRLAGLGRSVDSITKAVLGIAHAVGDNVAERAAVAAMASDFTELAELPAGGSGRYADVEKIVADVAALPLLLDLADEFGRRKAAKGFVEFSDQVAFALEIIQKAPRVVTDFRSRFKVVLLDEYQDTSVVQTWLLSGLFAGHPVMAVGDPNQSIYGWRGASAANLDEFGSQFGAGSPRPVQYFALSRSWRNGRDILKVANALVRPLLATTRVDVLELEAAPNASEIPVTVSVSEDITQEADEVARWMADRLAQSGAKASGAPAATAAMLFRARKTQGVFIEALRRHGVPYHVLGIGGLMEEPEIADLVSALTVIDDPGAGSELVRLLAGSRWRIGVRDLSILRRLASQLSRRDIDQRPLSDEVRQRLRESVAAGEDGSIVDALDFLAVARPGHGLFGLRDEFSTVGLERLTDAATTIARLRRRSGLELLDFVTHVEQELMIDIEVGANESRVRERANLEAFFDALGSYLSVDDSATLGGFLGWLREAEWRDDLSPRAEEAEPGTVQLLTIHGSKGLEWDIVAVPRMVEDELPGRPTGGTNAWLGFGELPYEFRGDGDELPQLAWRGVETRKEFLEAVKTFKASVADHHTLEERRLAYVAITRARHSLMLSASWWAGQSRARPPSSFLVPLAAEGIIAPLPEAPESAENPLDLEGSSFQWPYDPLGGRRAAVETGARLVEEAIGRVAARETGDTAETGRWERDLGLLLDERALRLRGESGVEVPNRIPASRFKDYITDASAVMATLRRPMPEKPYRATRLGTLFHDWVEHRAGVFGRLETLDAFGDESDIESVPLEQERLQELQATFEASEWAHREPVEVEREIHLPLGGHIVICKLDAVYRLDDGRYQIVDWKTGRAPRNAIDLEEKQLQLALYRQAYAEWKGISASDIDAVFYYVADDATIRPARIFERDELERLWAER